MWSNNQKAAREEQTQTLSCGATRIEPHILSAPLIGSSDCFLLHILCGAVIGYASAENGTKYSVSCQATAALFTKTFPFSFQLTYLLGAKDMILVQAALRNANSAGYKVQSNKLFSRNSGNFLRISEKRIDGLGKADDNDCMSVPI